MKVFEPIDVKGKVVFISSDSLRDEEARNIGAYVQAMGGAGLIVLPSDACAVSITTLEEALKTLQDIKYAKIQET